MMEALVGTFRQYPELAVFLTLALGYWFGNIKFGKFSFGSVTGTLLAGLLVGQWHIAVSPLLSQVFFLMSLFAIGYKVGPQFFRGLKKDGLPLMAYATFLCVVGLFVAWGMAKFLGLDAGLAAGLIAGSFTETAVIGTATEAINTLNIPNAQKQILLSHVPIANAVTYVFGTVGVAWFLSSLGPRLLRIDLKEAARALEKRMGGGSALEPGVFSGARRYDIRAYRAEADWLEGLTVADLEDRFKDRVLFVERIRDQEGIRRAEPATVISPGQVLALTGRKDSLPDTGRLIGAEVSDQELLDIPVAIIDAVLTNKELAGKTLLELRSLEVARGVGLRKILRAGQEIPFTPQTSVERGDVLELVGPQQRVEAAAQIVGYPDPPTNKTDIVFVGTGIVLGGILGTLYIMAGGMKVSLSAPLGALLGGLVFGWLRTVHRTFGRIPDPAQWLMESLGLAVFVACVGIQAGPAFVSALKQSGISLLLGGILVTLVPHTLGLFFGRHVLKLDPVILLGANAGSLTCTAALAAVQERAGSQIAVIGYSLTYAVGNIFLVLWGPLIVMLMS